MVKLPRIKFQQIADIPEDKIVSKAWILSYLGWSPEWISLLPKDRKTWELDLVLGTERKIAFRSLCQRSLQVSLSTLKSDHFFTDGIIQAIGLKPDALVKNPHVASGPPMRLYRIGKLNMVKAIPEVRAALDDVMSKREARSKGQISAWQGKRAAWIIAFRANTKEFQLHDGLTIQKVNRAVMRFHDLSSFDGIDQATLARWQVNAIRHNFTFYDHVLMFDMPPGQAGHDCYVILKNHVLGLIAAKFPALADACKSQMM